MHPSVTQYARSLEELTQGAGAAKVEETVKSFIGFLKRRGEGKKMVAIVKRLEKMEAEKKGQVSVTVTTAHEVETGTKHTLLHRAGKLFSKKKVELHYRVDKDVIGGAVFRTDEVLYDVTLTAELKELKKILKK